MTTKLISRCLLALGLASAGASALASPNVGVTVNVNQPGFYGRVEIGRVPTPPVLLYPQPVVIVPGQVAYREPIYLHVPPGHAKNWSRHCRRYNACGQPVYFVKDDWYRNHYYQRPQPRVESYRHDDRRDRRDDRHDDRHDHGRGHGHGHGHGR
jgi:hypothetical protein